MGNSVGRSLISGGIFTGRSIDKVVNGNSQGQTEPLRTTTGAAQFTNTLGEYSKTGAVGAKTAGNICDGIDNLAKRSDMVGKCASGLNWARTHVNPLVGVCAAYKVATADDKEKAFCTEAPGFMGMLASEHAYKQFEKSGVNAKVLKTIEDQANKLAAKFIKNPTGKVGKVASLVAAGIGFAIASIGGYSLGSAAGEYAITKEREMKASQHTVATA